MSRNKFNSSTISNIGEEEFINILSILEVERLIKVNFPTGRKNLQYSITIKLYESIINYFNNKKAKNKINRRDIIKTYIPIIISIIALFKSFQPEIISIWNELMILLKSILGK